MPQQPGLMLAETPLSTAEEMALWLRFKGGGDLSARERLITSYLGFARIMAARCYARRYRDGIGFNDYLQYGSVGLIEAVDHFIPDDGRASFKTYAAHRIRGAILNGLGHSSEVNAQLAAEQRIRQERLASLAERCASPDAADNADADPFSDMARTALGLAIGFLLDDARTRQADELVTDDDCYANSQMHRLRARLTQLVGHLPERERHLIQRHYFEDTPFDEIAVSLQVSRGRVSQLHKKALETLLDEFGVGRFTDWSV